MRASRENGIIVIERRESVVEKLLGSGEGVRGVMRGADIIANEGVEEDDGVIRLL